MKVFISSVRRGLELERDALPGLIRAIGFEPSRFEDYSAQSAPSREACMAGVDASDVYVLLLGPHYGHPFDDTGQSPTHDEWVAAVSRGMPRLVFKKVGIEYDPDQLAFIRSVGGYTSGVFYNEFTSVEQLQVKVAQALRDVAAAPPQLRFDTLSAPVEVPWRPGPNPNYVVGRSHIGPALELHAIPIGASPRSTRLMTELAASLPGRIRNAGLVGQNVAIRPDQSDQSVSVQFDVERVGFNQTQRPAVIGLSVHATGTVSVWASLPADGMGAVLDGADLPSQVAGLLRNIGALKIIDTETIALALGLDSSAAVPGTVASLPRSSASMGSGSNRPVHLEPDETVTIAALGVGAIEAARPLASALIERAAPRR